MYRIKDEWGEFLVRLARRAVEEYVRHKRVIEPPEDTPTELWEKMGVFVTLNRHNVPPPPDGTERMHRLSAPDIPAR